MRLRHRTRKPQQPQPLPFTETQIRERAYQLWQADPEGSAEAHWEGAIESLRRERSLLGRVGKSWQTAFSPEHRGFTLDAIKTWISALGLLATVTAGVGLYLNYQQGQEKLVTDRFAKSVEQLGSKEPDVRIGAIYSLERIAKDSPKDHWTIMEVLMAFVRNKSPLTKDWKQNSKQKLTDVPTDVQSALTVIGRREVKHDPDRKWLSFAKADLSNAYFGFAQLFLTDFDKGNLEGADFREANLENAFFDDARVSGADFRDANLNHAYFRRTHGLTITQVKEANNWQTAHYSPAFRKQLGLPPEAPKP